jgi:hypothetical protein
MQKLPEVESAKALMIEAAGWSVLKWLTEKKKVRKAADKANEALDRAIHETKEMWSDELKAAYALLGSKDTKSEQAAEIDPQLLKYVKQVKRVDEEAFRARMDAEDTFDKAEQILSTSLAREGTKKAIFSWELHERAIEAAEAGTNSKTI